MTTVISVRGRSAKELKGDPNFVYVGRAARGGWKASPWGNPFRFKPPNTMVIDFGVVDIAWFNTQATVDRSMSTAEKCVDLYRQWIAFREPLMARRFSELKGKTLGCWCGDWRHGDPEIPCHAVVLAKLAEGEKS